MTTQHPEKHITTEQEAIDAVTKGKYPDCAKAMRELLHAAIHDLHMELEDAVDYAEMVHQARDHGAGADNTPALQAEFATEEDLLNALRQGWIDGEHPEFAEPTVILYKLYRSWGVNEGWSSDRALHPFYAQLQAEKNKQAVAEFYAQLEASDMEPRVKVVVRVKFDEFINRGLDVEQAQMATALWAMNGGLDNALDETEEAPEDEGNDDDDDLGWLPPNVSRFVN